MLRDSLGPAGRHCQRVGRSHSCRGLHREGLGRNKSLRTLPSRLFSLERLAEIRHLGSLSLASIRSRAPRRRSSPEESSLVSSFTSCFGTDCMLTANYLTVGGTNSSLFTGTMNFVPLTNSGMRLYNLTRRMLISLAPATGSYWLIPLQDVSVGGTSVGVSATSVAIDTGTSATSSHDSLEKTLALKHSPSPRPHWRTFKRHRSHIREDPELPAG